MAPKSQNPSQSKGKGKASYEEKGKRKAVPQTEDVSSSPSPPRKRTTRRGPGIHISEGIPTSSLSNPFRSEADERKFFENFAQRKFAKNKAVDFDFFEEENFEFPKWLKDYGLMEFLSFKESEYEELLRLFYFYLKWDEGVKKYTSYVRGVYIAFSLQEFAEIMRLPYDTEDQETEFSTAEKIEFLTGQNNLPDAAFFTRELKNVDYRVLFNIVCHCIYPRAGGFDKVNLDDIEVMFSLIKGLKMSLVKTMVNYMLDQKVRKNGYLPYAMILTRLFSHFKVDLKKEKSQKTTSYSVIKDSTLKRMRITKLEGRWISKMQDLHDEEHEDMGQGEEQDGAAHEQAEEEDQAGFDHFPMEDLLGSSTPTQTHSIPHTPLTTPTPQPSTSAHPSSVSIDFSQIQSYLAAQFSQLNSHLSQVESKVDQVNSDFHSFKLEVKTQLSDTQAKMDMIELSFANHCPSISQTLQELQQYQKLHHEALRKSLHEASVALKDIRDNSDRLCLEFKLPTLGEILKNLGEQLKQEYLKTRKNRPPPPPPSPPKPKTKSKPSTSKPSKPSKFKQPKPEPESSPHVDISSDETSSNTGSSYNSGADPYVDKAGSESE